MPSGRGCSRSSWLAAGQGDGVLQDRLGLAHLRAERVHRLPLARGPPPVRGLRAGAAGRAVRPPARARGAREPRAADPAQGLVRDRQAAADGGVRDPGPAGEAAASRSTRRPRRATSARRWSIRPTQGAPGGRASRCAEKPVSARAADRWTARRFVIDRPRAVVGRSQPLRLRARGPERVAPALRAAAARRGLVRRRPRVDQRHRRQRPARRRAPAGAGRRDRRPGHRACASTSTDWIERPSVRSDRGPAQVRLPRRALPVPAVGGAQRAARPRPPGDRLVRRRTSARRTTRGRTPAGWWSSAAAGLRAARRSGSDPGSTSGAPRANEISIEDTFASGRHARLYDREGVVYIEDMSSTNGTYVNGRRLGAQQVLRPSDRIRIGDTEFRFEQ